MSSQYLEPNFLVMTFVFFSLNNSIPSPEYKRLPIFIIPDKIIQQYNLLSIINNDFVNILIKKSMYSLPP